MYTKLGNTSNKIYTSEHLFPNAHMLVSDLLLCIIKSNSSSCNDILDIVIFKIVLNIIYSTCLFKRNVLNTRLIVLYSLFCDSFFIDYVSQKFL